MNEKWDDIQGKLNLVRVSGGGGGVRVIRVRDSQGFCSTSKGKKPVKLIVQTTFAEKLKQKGA